MQLAEVLTGVRLRVGVRGCHRIAHANHKGTAVQVRGGFEHPSKSARHLTPPYRWFFYLWSNAVGTIFAAVADLFERGDGKACLGCATKQEQRWLAPTDRAQSEPEDVKMILVVARWSLQTRWLEGLLLLP